MSETGYAKSFFGGLADDIKLAMTRFIDQILPFTQFGPIAHQTKATNFNGFYLQSTTLTSTGEFSIAHGLSRTPYLAKVCADLGSTGSGFPVLVVSHAADAQRVYFRAEAGSTNMPFTIYVE